MKYLLTFLTQLDAVIAREKIKSKNGLCKLSPVPRTLSSSCGTCAIVENTELETIKELEFEELFKVENSEYIRVNL